MTTILDLGRVTIEPIQFGKKDGLLRMHAVQGDSKSRTFRFRIKDEDGMIITALPTGSSLRMFVASSDGGIGFQPGTFSNGFGSVTLPAGLLLKPGKATGQIQLYNSETQEKLSSFPFAMEIHESLEMGAELGADFWFDFTELKAGVSEVNALADAYETALNQQGILAQEVQTNADDVRAKYPTIVTYYTEMKTVIDAENARATAENERESAESARAGAETARATAWTALKNYWDQSIRPYWDNTIRPTWNSMTNTWNSWVDTWAGWVTAEGTRQTNEGARQNQESVRQANEGNRVDAEASREAQWATWDTTMQGVISHATESAPGIVTVRKTTAETATPYRVPTIGDMSDKLGNKVDKITGKGLSENDYTTTEKNKLSGIATGANNYSLPTASAATLGGIRVGANLEIANGVLAATFALATTSANGLMSASDKSKLDGIASGANNYTHPANHPASMIAQDTSRRMVSDAQISAWNGKLDLTGGQMSGALVVAQSTQYTSRMARNVALVTVAPTSASGYKNGDIVMVYE